MVPGEVITRSGDVVLNDGSQAMSLEVANSGDRPIQVGSHYHFAETNPALVFDRVAARGLRHRRAIRAGTDARGHARADSRRAKGFRFQWQGDGAALTDAVRRQPISFDRPLSIARSKAGQ